VAIASLALAESIGCQEEMEPAQYAWVTTKLIPNDVDGLVDFVSHLYTGETVGEFGRESSEWDAHVRLSNLLDRATALKLLHHPKPAVRVWLARIILERFPDDRQSVLPLLQDQSSVHTERGVITLEDTVALLVKELLYEFDSKASHPQAAQDAGTD
jgi:hypothetical protein